ncbi:MAG TPA: anti-sigma factor [Thermoanaerobaculia bacterium]|nr:anti-sigma factor [Thermoanaerobaculia bacterium]
MTHEEIQQLAALDAINAATPEEVAELRRHLATCDDCRRAADELHEAAALIALGVDPDTPPPAAKENILRHVGRASARPVLQWWLAAAAALFLVLFLWTASQLRDAREQVAQLQSDREKLTGMIATLSRSRVIQLAGQEIAPRASANVFLDPSQRRAFIFFHGLPANPDDKSYQLWIIRADQAKPMSAGVFNVDATGNAALVVQNIPIDTLIKALAVTLEPRGGVKAPTGQKYLVGS